MNPQPSILVADDDEVSLKLLGNFFQQRGWSWKAATNGKSALEVYAQQKFDIVITDYIMPDLDGHELLRLIRDKNPSQAVIMLTGTATVDEIIRSVRSGASDILLKPIDYQTLKQAVERILGGLKGGKEQEELLQGLSAEHSTFEFYAEDVPRKKLSLGVVDRLSKLGRLDRDVSLRIQLAFQEAFANSFEHGTLELESSWKDEFDEQGNDKFSIVKAQRLKEPHFSRRKIWITADYKDRRLTITVKDEGRGFTLRRSSDGTAEQKQLRCYGRGLALISGIMDEVLFEDQGRQLIMVKYLV